MKSVLVIAADNDIGAETVSNIINEWKKGIEDSEYDSVRELTVSLKKQGIGLSDLACSARLNNYIKKLGSKEDQIELFIVNCINGANFLPPEKIIHLTNQLFDIAKSESIQQAEVPVYTRQFPSLCKLIEADTIEVLLPSLPPGYFSVLI
jgi:hypothetical protein